MRERRPCSLPRFNLFLAALFSILLLFGCGGAVTQSSQSPSIPDATPDPTPTPSPKPTPSPTPYFSLELPTSSISFGEVPLGGTLSQRLTVYNSGNRPVQISELVSTSTGFTVVGPQIPVTIREGRSLVVTVVFTPESVGPDAATISFVSNASNSPAVLEVAGLGVLGSDHSITLSWNASQSVVTGYYVYRGGRPGGPYQLLNLSAERRTAYTDDTVRAGARYYYVVTAVDDEGRESVYSNEATAAVPSP